MKHHAADLPYGTVETITGGENVLILVPSPGDESAMCGGLIAAGCQRGRPPFVMVLEDGTAALPGGDADAGDAGRLAQEHARRTRMAVGCLGLDGERLLMAGLHGATIPGEGPVFDAIVRAVTLVMWRQDCNVVCAPWPEPGGRNDEQAAWRIAAAVAAGSGVGLLGYAGHRHAALLPGGMRGWRLDMTSQLAAKRHALAAHGRIGPSLPQADEAAQEVFVAVPLQTIV